MAEYIERTEELMLAMNAGARAIENTKRYHGAVYTKDLFSDNPQKIPYLQAAKVLRKVSDAPAVDVAPVVHGRWITHYRSGTPVAEGYVSTCCDMWSKHKRNYCPNCGAKMDGGDNAEG